MPFLDATRDTVVIRIVYDGAPMAGKTTSVQALARGVGGQVVVPDELAGRTLYFDWLDYTGGLFEGRPIRCQIVSVPGQKALARRRRRILASADAVVFVADSTPDAHAATCTALAGLRDQLATIPGPGVGIVYQANKRDHPQAIPRADLCASLEQAGLDVGIVESVATEGTGVRQAFVFAVRLALDRVSELMRTGELASSRPPIDSADELLADLQAAEEPSPGSQGPTADDEASLPGDHAPGAAAADGLLPSGVAVAVDAFADAMRRDAAPPAAKRAAANGTPALPAADMSSGLIWPPVEGRLLLHTAAVAATGAAPMRDPAGDWQAAAAGWLFHSPAHAFDSIETGRAALAAWAAVHAAGQAVLTPRRCLALTADADGSFRLWQVAALERTLHDELRAAADRGVDLVATALVQAVSGLIAGARLWRAKGPYHLPLSLRRVAATGSRYVGPVPYETKPTDRSKRADAEAWRMVAADLSAVVPEAAPERRSLRHQLDALVPASPTEETARRFLRDWLGAS